MYGYLPDKNEAPSPLITTYANNPLFADPPTYLIFAEYSEPIDSQSENDMDDTDPILRALLPVPSSQDRSNLRNYSGMATVIDSRVICVRPSIIDAPAENHTGLLLRGTIRASRNVSRADPIALYDGDTYDVGSNRLGVPYGCLVPYSISAGSMEPGGWLTVVCTVDADGGMVGQFWSMAHLSKDFGRGDVYVIINATGPRGTWTELSGQKSVRSEGRNEWLEMYYGTNSEVNFSVSLCFTALSSTNLSIEASIESPHDEQTSLYEGSGHDQGISASVNRQIGPSPLHLNRKGVVSWICTVKTGCCL